MRKFLLPIIAIIGALFGLFIVFWSQKETPVAPILFPPAKSPYAHAIAGAGLIEASSENIAIGSPFQEIIEKVFVTEGDLVKAGDPLFQLDLKNFKAALASAKAALELAQVTLQDKKAQFSFYERVQNKKSVSEQIYNQALYALQEAEANVKVAEANLLQAEVDIDRSTIRAPIDGMILQVNIHPGEIAPVIPLLAAASSWTVAAEGNLILMGRVNPLQLRIDIDEEDSWRFEKGSKAMAFVRGNSRLAIPLEFYQVQPYIIPKSSFTGQTAERVDTRVLQVLYRFEKKDMPVYAGQILDVFIESKPFSYFAEK